MRPLIVTLLIAFALSFAAPAGALEGWQRLGTRTVEFGGDSDTIPVGPYEGRFRTVVFEVERGTIELNNVTIHFANGRDFTPRTRLVFRDGQRSRPIDLPGAVRLIRSITFNYRSLRTGEGRGREERAVINVYGR